MSRPGPTGVIYEAVIVVSIDIVPKTTSEIHAEVERHLDRPVNRNAVSSSIRRAVQRGCAVRHIEGGVFRYTEPVDGLSGLEAIG